MLSVFSLPLVSFGFNFWERTATWKGNASLAAISSRAAPVISAFRRRVVTWVRRRRCCATNEAVCRTNTARFLVRRRSIQEVLRTTNESCLSWRVSQRHFRIRMICGTGRLESGGFKPFGSRTWPVRFQNACLVQGVTCQCHGLERDSNRRMSDIFPLYKATS